MNKMAKKEPTLGSLVDGMIKVIDDARRSATKVPVDTSSFITMAFYLGELRDILTHLNTKQPQTRDFASQYADAYNGLQRLKGTLQKLQHMTYRAAHESSRLLLIFDTARMMGQLQTAVQEVGHDLNLVPVLSLMSSFLPSDVSDKLGDLRSRMRAAKFDSESEVLDLCTKLDDAILQQSKEKATEALARVLRYFGAISNVGGSAAAGNAEVQSLSGEVQRDLEVAEKDQRWSDVEKLQDLQTFLGLASLSQEAPIVQATSRLALRLQETEAELAVPPEFKCSMTGEVMRDPVLLVETGQTFDRPAIEAWFAKENRTCPATGKRLRSLDLAPNGPLRKAIEDNYEKLNERTLRKAVALVRTNQDALAQLDTADVASQAATSAGDAGRATSDVAHGEGQAREPTNRAEAAAGAAAGQSAGATWQDPARGIGRRLMEEALESLAQLTSLCPKHALLALNLGAVLPLVELISPTAGFQAGDSLREHTLAVLQNIASTGERAVLAMLEAGVVPPLVQLIASDAPDVAVAIRLMHELSRVGPARQMFTDDLGIVEAIKLLNKHPEGGGPAADELGAEIAAVLEIYWRDDPYVAIQMASVGMFKPLIELLGPGNDVETRLMMADGVMQWGVNKASRVTLVQGGVLPPLVDLLNNGPPEARAAAARSIEHLSHTDINRGALAKAGVIPALVKALAKGGPELRAAAQATLANLAMDDQDLDSLDEDGTAARLVAMLRNGQQANRDYAIRTLECMARESRSIKSALLEDSGATPAIFDVLRQGPGHSFTAGSLRSTALLLLSHLCFEPEAKNVLVPPPEVVQFLVGLLNRPIPQDERQAIALLMATMAGNPKTRGLVRGEENAYEVMSKKLVIGTPQVQERMMWGFAHLAEYDESEPHQVIATQQVTARLGVLPIAVKYLKMGPDVMRIPSTLLLANMALSTPSLASLASSERKQGRSKTWAKLSFTRSSSFTSTSSALSSSSSSSTSSTQASSLSSPTLTLCPATKDKLRSCKVHNGKCSLEATFCLVEGDVVGVLLELARLAEDKVAEVALTAIGSLLADEEDRERAAEYLVKLEAIDVASALVGRTKNLTKWALYILERILQFKRFRAEKLAQPAVTALARYLTTVTGKERKSAMEAIQKMGILPKSAF